MMYGMFMFILLVTNSLRVPIAVAFAITLSGYDQASDAFFSLGGFLALVIHG